MARILLAAATLEAGRGGIARVARMSARALAEAGHTVDAVSYLDSNDPGLPIASFAAARASKIRFAMLCHAAAGRADVAIYDSVGIARARPRLPGIRRPYAIWMHGIEAWEALPPAAKAALQGAELVLVNSHYTLRRFQQLHGRLPNARVCWLATEDDIPGEPAVRAPDRSPCLLVLARVESSEGYKGHAELLAAWPRVVAEVPEARLIFAGGGSGVTALREQAAVSPASNRVEVLGFVPEAELAGLWARATAFAMPSRGEGFGLVYIEAMRHGLPVIASVHDAGSEVNLDGVTGFNVSLDTSEQLGQRILALLGKGDLAATMGKAARARWSEHFRYSAFRTRLRGAVGELVSG